MGREKRVKSDLAGKKDDIAQRGNGERKKKGKKKRVIPTWPLVPIC